MIQGHNTLTNDLGAWAFALLHLAQHALLSIVFESQWQWRQPQSHERLCEKTFEADGGKPHPGVSAQLLPQFWSEFCGGRGKAKFVHYSSWRAQPLPLRKLITIF